MSDRWRWWAVAIIPRWVASWLWCAEWIPLGTWAPYILGQSLGRKGTPLAEMGAP